MENINEWRANEIFFIDFLVIVFCLIACVDCDFESELSRPQISAKEVISAHSF